MDREPLRIAFVLATPGTTWGGMEKHTQELASALAQRGHHINVLGDERYRSRFAGTMQFHALPIHLSRRNPWLHLKLRRALARIQPDVVHAHGNKAAQLVSRTLWSAAQPGITVGTVHGTKSRHGAYNPLDGVIAVSDEIAASLSHARVRRIYNGTAVTANGNHASPLPHRHPLIIAMGRLEPVKGFDRLLKAWAISRPEGQLVILGEGSERPHLEQLLRSLRLEKTVSLPGYQDDLTPWFEQADCCVISSDREGLPYAMVEALLAQCPVLATPVSGVREFLPQDCVARSHLAEDIAQLLKQKLGTNLGEQQIDAFEKAAANLTLDAMTAQTLDFYRMLLARIDNQLIDLSGNSPFASGFNRHCHVHPDDPNTCLKVIRPDNLKARFRRQRWYKKMLGSRRLDDNRQEQRAYQQIAIERGAANVWAHLPRFWGTVETSQGIANASELLRTADGNPAPTLETQLKTNGLTPSLTAAITRFTDWLANTGILTRNLLPHNLVLADENGKPELYLIDGLGAPLMARLLSSIPAWRRRYIRRRVQRFWLRIEWELGDRSERWEEAQRIR